MPLFELSKEIIFPDPELSLQDGLLAIGGDLSVERLIQAYATGIFPWFTDSGPIMWWSPNPRMVLYPKDFKISKSLRRKINKGQFEIRFDYDFEEVIKRCADKARFDQDGTWITTEMMEAYISLHKYGYAHSVETYMNNNLVGGLYGVSLGKAFFGESMFFEESDASKIAFYHLVEQLKDWDFHFIDAQVETEHLQSLGAINIPRSRFLNELKIAINEPTIKGKW